MSLYSIDNKEIRRFGLIAFLFFGILSALGAWRQRPIPMYLFGALSLWGAGFILFPSNLRPLYHGWLRVGRKMGLVMTALILTLAYYLVITPSAWMKRMFGGRPIPTEPDRNLTSYWVDRSEPAQPKERFFKRY